LGDNTVSDGNFDPEVTPDPSGMVRDIDERFERRVVMNVPDRHNPKLHRAIELVNADDDLYGLWIAANVNAVERLGMTDHGPVHVKIVMNIAVRMLRLLMEADIEPSVVRNYLLEPEDAEVVVALAALLHDVGMSIHRPDHEAYSLFIARSKLEGILSEIYDTPRQTIITAEILHAIISHRSGGDPLTVEAGVVRIADALDMAKGRSRIPFSSGSLSIHSVSAAAVESVSIDRGEHSPICVTIELSNSAGLFQLDQLLRKKVNGSGIEKHLEIQARVGEEEKQLLTNFRL
jgi:metal-dependent HD superfamily phosphatase/phosphodiesterase